jgi:putative SOS response-associated peptidase YedK
MCNYNGIIVRQSEFIRLKELELEVERYNLSRPVQSGFIYQDWPVLRPGKDCRAVLDMIEWGFIPSYIRNREEVKKFRNGYKDEKTGKWVPGYTTLNCKGEELLAKDPKTGRPKMFRDAALKRRCLFVSSGFYEWRHIQVVGKSGKLLKTSEKFPYRIHVKEQPYFFIAGIWQRWTDLDTGETVDTGALATTCANGVMKQIHNAKERMPTMLTEDLAAEWISDGLSEDRITELATYKLPSSLMDAYTLDREFMKSDDPLKPISYGNVPDLIFEDGV